MAKMTSDELQGILSGLIEDAQEFTDSELSPIRAKGTEYYDGRMADLPNDEGRSSMVSKDLRDTVMAMMPSLMRVFFSSDKPVEYIPTGPEDVMVAEQATDYANYILTQENDGFMVIYAAFKDALIRKIGFVKAWWDESQETTTQRYTGLDEQTLAVFSQEPETEVEILGEFYEDEQAQDPQTGQPITLPVRYVDCKVVKTSTKGKIMVCEVPPEEVIVCRNDRYLGESYIGHRRYATVSDLVAMGYDRDLIEENATVESFEDNEEWLARTDYTQYETDGSMANPAMRKVLYVESYARIDINGDGIAELVKICTIGSGHEIVAQEEVDYHPFVAFTVDPEPHLSPVEATSIADDLFDIQKLKSAVWRNSLDSLAQSINPRYGVVEGQVNIDDVQNNEVGALIRMRNPQAVVPLITPDVSPSGLNMLGYIDTVKESRTGMSKAAMGLDSDALKSTATNAANAIVTATQSRIELVARVLSNGFKDLFKLMLKLMVAHQDKPKMIRLRNQWVSMDPRTWNAGMDVTINVALGTGTNQEKIALLNAVAMKQEQIIQLMGPSNPMVSLPQYVNTLRKMVELGGYKGTDQFFNNLPPDFQMPPAQPQQDPNAQAVQMMAQVEQQKAQAKAQVDQMKMQLEAQKAQMNAEKEAAKLQLDREQMQADMARKNLELQMQEAKMMAELRMKEAESVLKQLTMLQKGESNGLRSANEENEAEESYEQEAQKESLMAQAIMTLGQLISQTQAQTAQALSRPKRVLRDQQGRVVGVAPMDSESGESDND